MMKNLWTLAMMAMLSGCSMWNDLSWDSLNPWAESEDDIKVEEPTQAEKVLPQNVNKYLWQASLDKLAVLVIETETPEDGCIISAWKKSTDNERFKIVSEIDGGELRADALNVKVYKEVFRNNAWIKTAPSKSFENAVAQAIIKQAKILYMNDKD